jgi:hypothetical protein
MDSIRYKELLVKSLFELGILCYPSNGKVGLKGWNDFTDKEEYLKRALALLTNNPELNLAVNLGLSNVICIDIDDPKSFQRLYNPENFLTLSCRTPKGHHIFLQNDIGLEENISLPKFGVEILCKNHLAIIHGENYQLDLKEIRKASEYKSFFDFILDISNSQSQNTKSQNKDNSLSEFLHTEVFNRVLHTEVYQEKKYTPDRFLYVNTPNDGFLYAKTPSEIFELLKRLEKDFEFIRYALNLFVGVEPKESMLCILHPEKHESAGFYRNKSGRWFYKDFHDGKVYSILDLILEVFKIPDSVKNLFRQAFASYLVRTFSSNREREINIVRILRGKSKELAKVYLLVVSLNNSPGEHFLSVRDLSGILNLGDITKANRLLNFLCLVGVFEKFKRGYGKAYGYKLREDIDLRELEREIERLKRVDIYKLSKEKAMQFFDKEKVEKIYLRASDKKEQKAKKRELVGAGAGVGHQTKKNLSNEEIRGFFNGKYLS